MTSVMAMARRKERLQTTPADAAAAAAAAAGLQHTTPRARHAPTGSLYWLSRPSYTSGQRTPFNRF